MENLEWQLSNLELSKKLKELEVKQESLFYWEEVVDEDNLKPELKYIDIKYTKDKFGEYDGGRKWQQKYYSAFTVAELFDKLPNGFFLGKDEDNGYYCGCCLEFIEEINPKFYKKLDEKFYGWLEEFAEEQTEDKNPANALAKMLIYLKENKLININ